MSRATIRHPSTVVIAGPTGCGKTQFLVKLLSSETAISPSPQRIVWVYAEWQPAYEELAQRMKERKIVLSFVKDVDGDELYNYFSRNVRNLLVLDDQMESGGGAASRQGSGPASSLARFFTQGSHHRNLTVVYVVQNLFNQDKAMRTVALNTHYLFVFKNPRDKTQIRTLGSQMFPGNSQFLVDSFVDATRSDYGYLFLDSRTDTPDELQVQTDVLSDTPSIYVPVDR